MTLASSSADGADLMVTGTAYQEIAANVAEFRGLPLAEVHYFPVRANTQVLPVRLPSPVVNDRLRLVISDDAAAGVAGLDGEWVNPDPRAVPPVRGSGYRLRADGGG